MEKELAEATKAVAEFGTKLVDRFSSAMAAVFGPLAKSVGTYMGNRFELWAADNLARTVERSQAKLLERGVEAPKSVHPSLGIPLLNEAAPHDDPTLQEIWATLLAKPLNNTYSRAVEIAEYYCAEKAVSE